MTDRNTLMTALTLEVTAQAVKYPERARAPLTTRLGYLNAATMGVGHEVLDGLHIGPHGIVCTHDVNRVGCALLALAANALLMLDALDVDPLTLFPPSCNYCEHGQPSTRDGGVYCTRMRVHKPDAEPCDTGYVRRR